MAKKAGQKQEAATQQGALDEQMERLKIEDSKPLDEAALLEDAIKLATAGKEDQIGNFFANACYHGYVEPEDCLVIEDFSEAFFAEFMSAGAGAGDLGDSLTAAIIATKENEQYSVIWGDSSKLKLVTSFYIFNGTQHVLEGNIKGAKWFAAFAAFFQEYIAFCVDKRRGTVNSSKMIELASCDEHTLVKYLKKNIPCNCLEEKYKEVKSITKMGVCRNEKCSLPNRVVERSKMLYCTRCRA
eukprot:scaffold21168_cov141-Skeletonema_dohrnii-CCMP3373.AAC.2